MKPSQIDKIRFRKRNPFFQKLEDENLPSKMKDKTRKEIFYTLYTFGERNIPFYKTLEMLEREFPKEVVLSEIKKDILNGFPLSYSMKEHRVGDEFAQTTLLMGEEGGDLTKALRTVFEYYRDKEKIKEELLKISLYPLLVCMNIILLLFFSMYSIFPGLISMYHSAKVPLPLILKNFERFENLFRFHRGSIWVIITTIFFAVSSYFQKESARYQWNKFRLKLPLLGHLYRRFFLKNFMWRLSVLNTAGIKIKQSLHIMAEVEENSYFKQSLCEMEREIEKGIALSRAMEEQNLIFSKREVSYIRQGEESGALKDNICAMAIMHERDTERFISRLSAYGQPIMIVFLGLLVAGVAFSVMPLINMTDLYMD